MRLHKLLAAVCAAVLLTALALPATVALADPDENAVTIDPVTATVQSDTKATLNVSVHCGANRPNNMQNVKVLRGGTTIMSYSDDVTTGNTVTLSGPMTIQASDIGQKVTLTLSWTDGGAAQSQDFSVTLTPAQVNAEFSRTLSTTSAVAGDTVTLTYTVQNTGAVDLTDVTITDGGISSVKKTYSKIAAGSSVEFSYDMTVSADFTSTPKLVYTANGQSYTKTLTAKTVQLTQAQLDAVLEINPETVESGGEVTLLCTLTNSGNVQLNSITVSDETLGSKLYTLSKLAPGAKKSFSKTFTLVETTGFQYTIKAKDANGHEVTFQSNKATATVKSAANQNLNLEIIANSTTVQLTEPGNVDFELEVTNKGDAAVSNVRIIDQSGNPITVIDNLPPGKKAIAYKTLVNETTVFQFTAYADDGTEGGYKVTTGPLQVTVVEATANPTPSIEPTDDLAATAEATDADVPATASGGRLGTLLVLLAVVGVLIIITAVALVVMIVKERRKTAR